MAPTTQAVSSFNISYAIQMLGYLASPYSLGLFLLEKWTEVELMFPSPTWSSWP